MSKPRHIDLNKWERVKTAEEMDGYQCLIITPFQLEDGTQPPRLYFRKGIIKHNEIDDVDNTEWFKDIRISKEGGDDEYAHRVDWWYAKALEDEEYKKVLNATFNKDGFDVKKSWLMSQNYLKKFNYSARKTYIHKYVWNWLTNGMHQFLRTRR